jgi:hypothetical protein
VRIGGEGGANRASYDDPAAAIIVGVDLHRSLHLKVLSLDRVLEAARL